MGEREVILVECKWTSKPVGIDILVEPKRKAQLVKPELENHRVRFALCSRLIKDAKQRQDVTLFDLPEIVG